MNLKYIINILGSVLMILTALLILPLIAALCYGEAAAPFLITMAVSFALGFGLSRVKPDKTLVFANDGFISVGLCWIVLSLVSALPFVISGDIPNYVDAFFETVSGYTTTGSTIVANPEAMSRGCMFWRLFTHWIGGMGVIVFLLMILKKGGEQSMHIMRAEVPGPTVGKLVPRVKQSAMILYGIYIGLTLLQTVLLMLGGVSFYEALLHSFATAGTGGLSTRGASIAGFNSLYVEIVITVFMLLFAVNFNLYYLILLKRFRQITKNEELRTFIIIVIVAMIAIAAGIAKQYGGFWKGLRYSSFQVASIVSTTGFGTADYTEWPQYCQIIILMLMFCGGCAGSTAGGLKLGRVMIFLKACFADLKMVFRPRRVKTVKIDGKIISPEAVRAAYGYFTLYFILVLVVAFLVSFDGFDFATNFTAGVTVMSNVGPGFGVICPSGNFADFSSFSKVVLSVGMLLGRLEIYAILALFFPKERKH